MEFSNFVRITTSSSFYFQYLHLGFQTFFDEIKHGLGCAHVHLESRYPSAHPASLWTKTNRYIITNSISEICHFHFSRNKESSNVPAMGLENVSKSPYHGPSPEIYCYSQGTSPHCLLWPSFHSHTAFPWDCKPSFVLHNSTNLKGYLDMIYSTHANNLS